MTRSRYQGMTADQALWHRNDLDSTLSLRVRDAAVRETGEVAG
jgi:hypothetical protein